MEGSTSKVSQTQRRSRDKKLEQMGCATPIHWSKYTTLPTERTKQQFLNNEKHGQCKY